MKNQENIFFKRKESKVNNVIFLFPNTFKPPLSDMCDNEQL